MNDVRQNNLPEYSEWSEVAVRLIQGAVYREDGRSWDLLMRNISALESYFGRIALQPVIDEAEGIAFLRQLSEDELPDGYDNVPGVLRRTRLSYESTILAVLLRDAYRQFEEQQLDQDRCLIRAEELFEHWRAFFPKQQDDVRLRRSLQSAIRTLEGLRFIRRSASVEKSWEIQRLIKARLVAAELEHVRNQLAAQLEAVPKKTDDV